jgi:hypothetical protein
VTVVQGLTLTIGLAPARITVIDTLRRKRNLSDYTGEDIDDSSAEHCIAVADRLLQEVTAWLTAHRPQLIRSSGSQPSDRGITVARPDYFGSTPGQSTNKS